MIDTQRRRELKSSYRESHPQAGIYRITNEATGRVLIGSAVNLAAARNRFDFAVKHRSMGALDQRLKRDAAEHGIESLSFDILETIDPPADATDAEIAADLKTLESLHREQLAGAELY